MAIDRSQQNWPEEEIGSLTSRMQTLHLSNEDLLLSLLDAYRGFQVTDQTKTLTQQEVDSRTNFLNLYQIYRKEVIRRMNS